MVPVARISGRMGNQMFQLAYIYAQMRKGLIPDIYVQDPAYFENCEEDIKVLFGDGISNIDKVAIHVRRGKNPVQPNEPKYSDNPFYVDLFRTDYYPKAMALFPGEKFLVISDDIEWCKTQEIFKDCSFSEGHTDVEDMNIMASCKGVITANSSYSWWGAYLSKGKVVAPLAWHPDGIERTKCPKSWIRV